MSSLIRRTGPFVHRNPRLFVWFRVLYNARAYSLGFSLLLAGLRGATGGESAFRQALSWQVGIVAVIFVAYFTWALRQPKTS